MICGLEGIHTPDVSFPVTLNDRSSFPRYKLRRIAGLRSRPDFAPPEADKATMRVGEVPRQGELLGKTIVYEGDVEATDLVMLREACEDLTAAFESTGEIRMDVEPHPSYAGPALPSRFYHGRPLECTVEEVPPTRVFGPTSGWRLPFTLSLRLSDPRYYFPTLATVTDDVLGDESGDGGFPVTPPLYLEPSSTDGLRVTCLNEGKAPTEATITVAGPVVNPRLSRVGTDYFLKFRDLTLEAGETLIVDSHARTARRGSGTNVTHKLHPASTWWDRGVEFLPRGSSEVRLRGYTIAAPASLSVAFYSADWS